MLLESSKQMQGKEETTRTNHNYRIYSIRAPGLCGAAIQVGTTAVYACGAGEDAQRLEQILQAMHYL